MRTIVRWAGTAACMLLALMFAASLKWQFWCAFTLSDRIGLGSGGFVIILGDVTNKDATRLWMMPNDWNWIPAIKPYFEEIGRTQLRPGTPVYRTYDLGIPLWIPFLMIAVPTAWLWYLDRRRPAPGKCRCGYDLTGNTSGRCPECGQTMTDAQ